MKLHELKTDPDVFDSVVRGEKNFEIRKNDRGYKVGDTLLLRKTKFTGKEMSAGADLIYTGEEWTVVVTYMLEGPIYGLADGWVIMSIRYIWYARN